MRPGTIALLVLAGIALGASPARADCSVETTPILFPPYDVYASAPVDVVGTLRYRCAPDRKGATAYIRISLQPAADGTFDRQMYRGKEGLRYNLFMDPGRTVVWGDGSAGTLAYVAACCPTAPFQTVNVYARIYPGQDVSSGSYVDNVVVAIEF